MENQQQKIPYEQRPEVKARRKAYYLSRRDELLTKRKAQLKEYQQRPEVKAQHNKQLRKYTREYRIDALKHYSPELKCQRCGFSDIRALSIDHINNDGSKHRKEIGKGRAIYYWLKNNNYPEGYQVLCMNCQFIKEHEKKQKPIANEKGGHLSAGVKERVRREGLDIPIVRPACRPVCSRINITSPSPPLGDKVIL
jgi:hypothetical protein